jgi:hypothetical protein
MVCLRLPYLLLAVLNIVLWLDAEPHQAAPPT